MKRYLAVERVDGFPFPRSLAITDKPEIPPDKDEDVGPSEVSDRTIPPVIQLQKDFFEQIHSYIDGLPSLVSMGPMLQGAAFFETVDFVENKISEGEPTKIDDWSFYEVLPANQERLRRSLKSSARRARSLDGISEMVLLGAVSQFDAFMGRLLRLCLDVRPDIIGKSEKTFAAHQVFEYSDLEAFREAVIEKTIESFLRKSHQDQFSWLSNAFDVKLTNGLSSWPKFIETFERRNLFAHSQGIVSETYRLKLLEAGWESVPDIGEKLSADPSYISERLQVFAEIGLKLAQVLGRKLDKSGSDLKEYEAAINDFGYQLIGHGHFSLAIEILNFGLSCPKFADEGTKMMMEVNLANALKLVGDNEESEKILADRQWSTASLDFEISVAAIRCDTKRVVELMPRFQTSDDEAKWALRHWPVFVHVRDQDDFQHAYKSRFNENFKAAFDLMTLDGVDDEHDKVETQ